MFTETRQAKLKVELDVTCLEISLNQGRKLLIFFYFRKANLPLVK